MHPRDFIPNPDMDTLELANRIKQLSASPEATAPHADFVGKCSHLSFVPTTAMHAFFRAFPALVGREDCYRAARGYEAARAFAEAYASAFDTNTVKAQEEELIRLFTAYIRYGHGVTLEWAAKAVRTLTMFRDDSLNLLMREDYCTIRPGTENEQIDEKVNLVLDKFATPEQRSACTTREERKALFDRLVQEDTA